MVLRPASLESLFPGIAAQSRDGNVFYRLPGTLSSDLPERGALPMLAVKLLEVFVRKAAAPAIRDLAVELEDKQTGGRLGLHIVADDFSLKNGDLVAVDNSPYLLFLHGTASSFEGAFGDLRGTDTWNSLRKMYGDRIIAFQHRTLSESLYRIWWIWRANCRSMRNCMW